MTSPIALCLGGAKSVWDDLAAAEALIGDAPRRIVACNFAGIAYPGHLDTWVTLHPELFDGWRADRAQAGRNTDYRQFCHQPAGDGVAVVGYQGRGSSGLYMAQVGLQETGCAAAILCGVPMDDTGGHIHWPGAWSQAELYRPAFEAAKAAGWNIRSMGGWTAELFGRPDAEWLAEMGITIQNAEAMVARIRFHADFDWHPTPVSTIAYKAGMEETVPRACRIAALNASVAIDVPPPRRQEGQDGD